MKQKRVALVTGTGGELGAAIAERLASEGYQVVGLDLRPPANAGKYSHYDCDLTDIAALGATLEQIRRELGPIQLLVNNAAYYNPISFWELTPEQIQRSMAVNVTAVMYSCQQVAKQMREAGGGVIVNMASIAGRGGTSQIDYGASKAGVINLTGTLGRLLAEHNIRVNAIAPALIDAGMGKVLPPAVKEKYLQTTPLKRAARSSEIANVVAFLASDEASYITGTTIDVNGGL
ncbi:SDR family NAD(P)-dependent oxidoreductase [Steroidobacter cummioxidans]|uniref:SDR family NAD(P)-dependent oxidoreductase n=1 Tax=Steroidobacter cummioxidans TaxID=1803913 RepID=UPI000E323D32|nr:SDR family NAD(P)-dependent oxidoreductase [Steroidobacter cummioxidans]